MTGQRESRVTCPQFSRLPGGDLLFLYRDGTSGRETLVLNRYSVAKGAWTAVQTNLVDGGGQRSPYWDMTVERQGTLHLAWVWRESPDVATNHDICHARSADEGRTWSGSDGPRFAVPIATPMAGYAVRIRQNSSLMNSPAITADDGGRPYLTTHWSARPGAAPRSHVVHREGAAWRSIEGPERFDVFMLAGGGTKAPPISRAVVLVEPAGRVGRIHLISRDSGPSGGGRVVAATLDRPGARTWVVRELTSGPIGAWEPAIDPAAWADLGQVHMLLRQVTQRDGDDRTGVAAPTPTGMLVWRPAADRSR